MEEKEEGGGEGGGGRREGEEGGGGSLWPTSQVKERPDMYRGWCASESEMTGNSEKFFFSSLAVC